MKIIVCNRCQKETEIEDKSKRKVCLICKKQICSENVKRSRYNENEQQKQKRLERVKNYNAVYCKDWYKKNKDRLKQYNLQQSRKYLSNPKNRLAHNIRAHINWAVKYQEVKKQDHTMKLIGCSKSQLIKHLESQFLPGMNWNNYGEWHIDHIIPLSSFNLLDREVQAKAFHFSNLQPLWKLDNLRKHNRLDYQITTSERLNA